MTLRAAIVDDEPLARERLRDLLGGEVEVVCECEDGPTAVEALRRQSVDAVFLDIRMPEMDGFEVLEALRGGKLPWVVFLTAYDEHAVRAFEERALDYLLKPVSRARLQETLQRIRERVASAANPDALAGWMADRALDRRLAVRDGQKIAFVTVREVEWIEAAGNYALVHTVHGETHILRETMRALEAALPPESFLRVSRSAIVNLGQVEQLAGDESCVVLAGGRKVGVARPLREVEARLRRV